MTPPQPKYLINDEHMYRIYLHGYNHKAWETCKEVEEVRSRPAPTPQSTCPQNKIWDHCPQAAAIRNATLDEVLNKLWEAHIIHPDSPEGKAIKRIVKSLRTQTQEPHP